MLRVAVRKTPITVPANRDFMETEETAAKASDKYSCRYRLILVYNSSHFNICFLGDAVLDRFMLHKPG